MDSCRQVSNGRSQGHGRTWLEHSFWMPTWSCDTQLGMSPSWKSCIPRSASCSHFCCRFFFLLVRDRAGGGDGGGSALTRDGDDLAITGDGVCSSRVTGRLHDSCFAAAPVVLHSMINSKSSARRNSCRCITWCITSSIKPCVPESDGRDDSTRTASSRHVCSSRRCYPVSMVVACLTSAGAAADGSTAIQGIVLATPYYSATGTLAGTRTAYYT